MGSTLTDSMGGPTQTVLTMQHLPATMVLGYYAGLAATYPWEEEKIGLFGAGRVHREPVGVVAALIPWNVPFFIACNKLAPALIAGCSVILTPAPETPLDANLLAEWLTEAGLPEGLLSVLPAGREVGEYLINHPGVDKVTFAASTAAGPRVGALPSERPKGG